MKWSFFGELAWWCFSIRHSSQSYSGWSISGNFFTTFSFAINLRPPKLRYPKLRCHNHDGSSMRAFKFYAYTLKVQLDCSILWYLYICNKSTSLIPKKKIMIFQMNIIAFSKSWLILNILFHIRHIIHIKTKIIFTFEMNEYFTSLLRWSFGEITKCYKLYIVSFMSLNKFRSRHIWFPTSILRYHISSFWSSLSANKRILSSFPFAA